MHLTHALGVLEDFYFEGFHNIIANILHVVLLDTPMLPPHALPQLEPQLSLEVDTLLNSKVRMSAITSGIRLHSSPKSSVDSPFISPKFHSSPASYFADRLHFTRTSWYFLSAAPLRTSCV